MRHHLCGKRRQVKETRMNLIAQIEAEQIASLAQKVAADAAGAA